jgi:chromosome segregation ATPase
MLDIRETALLMNLLENDRSRGPSKVIQTLLRYGQELNGSSSSGYSGIPGWITFGRFRSQKTEGAGLQEENKLQQNYIKELKNQFSGIEESVTEKALSLHIEGQSQLYQNIRELGNGEPITKVKALLKQYEEVLKERESLKAENIKLQAKHHQEIREHYDRGKREENQSSQNYITALEDQHKANIQRLTWSFQRDRERLEGNISELERRQTHYGLRISEMETEMDSEKKRHAEEMARIERIYKSTIDEMSTNHQSAISELKQDHANDVEKREQKHANKISKMKTDYAVELKKLEENHEAAKNHMRDDFDKREQKHAKKISKMKRDHAVELRKLEEKHEAAENLLRDDVEAYSGALLARDQNDFNMLERDTFKTMSDNDVEDRFLRLVQEVDTLSRLEWKQNRNAWTDQILSRLSTNQRLLKKQILQDSMWVLLHDFIFCSPFRIFGKEGQILESQWNKQCGKGQLLALFNPLSFACVDFSRRYPR